MANLEEGLQVLLLNYTQSWGYKWVKIDIFCGYIYK